MAHRRRGRPRGKCGKILYRDEIAAKLALAETLYRGRGENRIYECNICYGHVWHVTSHEQKTEK